MRRKARVLGALATATLTLGAALATAAAALSASATGRQGWNVPTATMDAALACPARSGRPPVLLIHGTGLTGAAWSTVLAPALAARGFAVCTIDLPLRATGDIQLSGEYVARAIAVIASRWHRRVGIVTHSQGGLEARWALRAYAHDWGLSGVVVELGAPNAGTAWVPLACTPGRTCQPALMQMLPGSRFLTALDRGDQTPGGARYVSIWSTTDGIISPIQPPTAALPGGTDLTVQSVCPGRSVDHVQLLTDPVVVSLVESALADHGVPDVGAARRACPSPAGAERIPGGNGPVATPGPEPRVWG